VARNTPRAWFLIPAIILLLIGLTVISIRTGPGLSQPFSGSRSAKVELGVPEAPADAVAKQVAARLALLEVDTAVVATREHSAELLVKRVDDPAEAAASVVQPEAVLVRPIVDARPHLPMDAPELKMPVAPGTEKLPLPFVVAPTRSEVRKVLQARGLPQGLEVALECVGSPSGEESGMCAAWLLGPEQLQGHHVLDATITSHRRTEEPLVTFKVDAEGARILEELTSKNLGRQAAIIALGEVRARPLMTEVSKGDAWTFSTRTGDTNRRQAVERAELIASSARLPPISRVTVDRVELVQ
jgi:hypothetical protein